MDPPSGRTILVADHFPHYLGMTFHTIAPPSWPDDNQSNTKKKTDYICTHHTLHINTALLFFYFFIFFSLFPVSQPKKFFFLLFK
jgi:hypothetical protein